MPAADHWPRAARIALLSTVLFGALVVAGSLITWAEAKVPFIGTIGVDGFDDGRKGAWLLVLGLAIMAVGASAPWGKWLGWRGAAAALLGIAAIYIALGEASDLRDVNQRIQLFGHGVVQTELKLGLPLAIVGGALATIAGVGTAFFVLARGRAAGAERSNPG